jgi:malate dehydrogenase
MAPSKRFKVAILGASGGIGQPLSLLLKMNERVDVLSLYDVVGTPGVGADVGHIDSIAKVEAFVGDLQDKAKSEAELAKALQGVQLALIPAGVPRKPGMTRDDLFNTNAGIVQGLAEGIAKVAPGAWVAIISNPVNSTVPIVAEVFKRAGTYDPKKVLGVTKLDVVRAKAFIGQIAGTDPKEVSIPVVGGHAGTTILPLLSQSQPAVNISEEEARKLTERIQNAGTEVVEAKAGKGSATLSMAYAAAAFAESCLRAMAGESGVTEYAYVESSVVEGVPFFASKVSLDTSGATPNSELGPLNDSESQALQSLKKELSDSIQKGVDFVHNGPIGS